MEIICGTYTTAKPQQWHTRPDENCWSYFHENFTKDIHWHTEVFVTIWKLSVEHRPCLMIHTARGDTCTILSAHLVIHVFGLCGSAYSRLRIINIKIICSIYDAKSITHVFGRAQAKVDIEIDDVNLLKFATSSSNPSLHLSKQGLQPTFSECYCIFLYFKMSILFT